MAGHVRSRSRHHTPHTYERMSKFEGAADILSLLGIMALGAAMAFGLLTASGHVTW